jgi:hypothetical protein
MQFVSRPISRRATTSSTMGNLQETSPARSLLCMATAHFPTTSPHTAPRCRRPALLILAQAFTDAVGHSTGGFTATGDSAVDCEPSGACQLLFVVKTMYRWLQGERPDPATFPKDLGFLPNFQPPPWPHVQPEQQCH